MISIQLFGHPQIKEDGEFIQIPRRKSRALVFYAASRQQPVSREELLAVFWPDLRRASGLQTLRTSLYGIRKVSEHLLRVTTEQVSCHPSVKVDVRLFEEGVSGTGGDIGSLAAALDGYRGEFLQNFYLPESIEFEDWLNQQREHYRQMALRGFAQLSSIYKQRKEYKTAIRSLDKALAIQPLQEDLHRERLLLHYLAGDRPRAIHLYDELRKLLDEELGVPPMAETRKLYDQILEDRILIGSVHQPSRPVPAKRSSTKDLGELPFVGREQELKYLDQELYRGKFVLVEGEAGIGKTRLVNEYLQHTGWLYLFGAARELEHHLPYQPIIEAFRNSFQTPQGREFLSTIENRLPLLWLDEVSRILPELSPAKPRRVMDESKADEARLWEGVRQLLWMMASEIPTCLVVDDLQWAGDSTLGLLGYLIRQDTPPSLFFLATARASISSQTYRNFLQNLTRQDLLYKLELPRLASEPIFKLAKSISTKFAPPLAEWLQKKSEGNPYFLVEIVKYARQKSIIQANGMLNLTDLASEGLVPKTVYSLLQSQLDKLSDTSRRMLDVGVILGRQFNFDVAASASGLSELSALEAIEELVDSGLVKAHGARHFEFEHALIIEVATQEIGDLRLRYLHRRAAETMSKLLPASMEEKAGLLAYHYSAAGEMDQAAVHARQAGKQALRQAAWREAIDFFHMALESKLVSDQDRDWESLAEAHAKAGEFAQSTEAYREALTLASQHSRPDSEMALLRLALARTLLPQGRYGEVVQIAQQVCDRASPENVMIAEMIWGTALSIEGSDLYTAQKHLSRAESLWKQNPGMPASTLGQILFESGNVAAQLGDLNQALEYYQQSLQVSLEYKDSYSLEQAILAYNNLAYHRHLLGEPDAQQDALKGLALAQEYGILGMQTYLYSTLGEISLAAGDLEKAETYFQTGLDFAYRYVIAERVAGITANLGLLALKREERELALHYLSTALGQSQSLGAKHLEANIHLWLVPVLPKAIALQHLHIAKEIASNSQRKRLLAQAQHLENSLTES